MSEKWMEYCENCKENDNIIIYKGFIIYIFCKLLPDKKIYFAEDRPFACGNIKERRRYKCWIKNLV